MIRVPSKDIHKLFSPVMLVENEVVRCDYEEVL